MVVILFALFFSQHQQSSQQPPERQVLSLFEAVSAIQSPRAALQKMQEAVLLEPSLNDSLQAALNLKVGVLYSKLYINDSALIFFNKALRKAEQHANWIVLNADIFNYLGNVSRSLSDSEKAMAYYNKGLGILEGASDRQAHLMESKLLGNIGGIYYDLNDYKKALEYAELGRDVSLKHGLTEHFQMDYLLVGFAARAAGEYEKAIENNEKALELMLASNDSSYLAHTYYNLASLYQVRNEPGDALRLFDQALNFAKLFGENEVLVSCLISKASITLAQGDASKAIDLSREAEKTSIDNTFLPKLVEALDLQYRALKKQGRYEAAVNVQDRYHVFRDSLYKVETRKSLDEIGTKYETSKKEQLIRQLEQENQIRSLQAESDKQMIYGTILLAALLAVVLGLYYNRYRIKQRAANILNAKNNELQQANLFRDRLFAVVSHDLKSPLSAFQTLTSAINDNLSVISEDQLRAFIRELNASSKEILNMLNNLLAWAISQTGQLGFKPAAFQPATLAQTVVRELNGAARQKEIDIYHEVNDEIMAYGDPALVQIILRNLLANAIKFSSARSAIELAIGSAGNGTMFSVRDQGMGIAGSDIEKLFRANQDVRSIGNSTEKGTGIGLMLCHELVAKHGGKIWAESEPGKGSIFCFILPHAGT